MQKGQSRDSPRYKVLLEALVGQCCDECQRARIQNPIESPVAFAFRLGGEQKVLHLFKNAYQALHHAEEGLDFGTWERDSKRYVVCAVDAAVYLGKAGLEASAAKACRRVLFEQLFRPGAQKLREQLVEPSRALRRCEAELEELRWEIAQDEAQFLMACEAVFRGRLPAEEADDLRKPLAVKRERLGKLERHHSVLVAERDAIVSLQDGFREFASIQCLEDFEDFLLLLEESAQGMSTTAPE